MGNWVPSFLRHLPWQGLQKYKTPRGFPAMEAICHRVRRVAGLPEPWQGQPTAGVCPSLSCLGIWSRWTCPRLAEGLQLIPAVSCHGAQGCGGDTAVPGSPWPR